MRRSDLILTLLLCCGCALFQAMTPPMPQSLAQGLILANYEAAAVVNAAADSYEQGLIGPDVLRTVTNAGEESRKALETAAGALELNDLTTAGDQLRAARLALTTARTMLGGDR